MERAKQEGRPGTAVTRVSFRDSDVDSDDEGALRGRSDSPSLQHRTGGVSDGVSYDEFTVWVLLKFIIDE